MSKGVNMKSKIIDNTPYTLKVYLNKLSKNSFLIKTLSKRELKIKYSKTLLGVGWVILQPLIVVTIYTIFFKNFIKLNTQEIPYPQFVLIGLVLWYLFTGIISKCTYSLIESQDLIYKVSFPRIIVLISKCVTVIIECFTLLVIAFIVLLFTNQNIGFYSITALFYFIQILLLSFSIGIICSIIVLKYRDLAHAIPFIINFGIWLTPVFYSVEIIPEQYKYLLLYGNPLALAIENLRACIFYNQGVSIAMWILFGISCLMFIISFYIFVKFEKRIIENL